MKRSLRLIGLAVATFTILGALAAPTYAAGDSIIVTVRVFPTPGREDELQARYLKQIEFLRKAEPTATFRLHRSAKEPAHFMWYETYESQSALDNHLKAVMPAFRKEAGATPEGLIARPSESETYRALAN